MRKALSMATGDGNVPISDRWTLNRGRLWASGAATAVVAALVAIVGILIARGLFKVAVLAPKDHGVWGNARTATYALSAALAAVLATGLIHLLCAAVAEPNRFFRWIMGLVTLIAVILPLTLTDAWSAKAATALINLAIGAVITVILDSVATAARRPLSPYRGDAATYRLPGPGVSGY
jgi:hypothetical protein